MVSGGSLRAHLRWWLKTNIVRPLCTPPPPPPPPPPLRRPPGMNLMNFPPIVWPSFIISCKNWIYTNFIIRPHFDREFEIYKFIEGAKQAVQVISMAMGESDFNTLRDLVSEEAYSELYHSVSGLSLAERESLIVNKNDIYLCFPYQIGIIFNNDDERRWVEITMVYHAMRGLSELKDRENFSSGSPFNEGSDMANKICICNYRFIREYTKGVKDSNWLVNIVNHFTEKDLRRR